MAKRNNSNCLEMINSIKSKMICNESSVNGPLYQYQNKQIADLYLKMQEESKAIYHLTEAHAATLRQYTVVRYDYKDDHIKNPTSTKKFPMAHGIKKKYVEFRNELSFNDENGLLSRLKDMPSEWTVVQLTGQFDAESRLKVRIKDSVYKPTALHITRLPCGTALAESCPITMLVDKPRWDEGMATLHEIMHKSTKELLRTKALRPREIRKARETASDNIKSVVDEMCKGYLREWKCLLLGTLCSNQYSNIVKSCIDTVLTSEKHVDTKVEERSRELLYCVANGCTSLTLAEIKSAISWLVSCKLLCKDLVSAIEELKQNNSVLMVARRNPVILIVDESLDIFPWEMLPIVKRHPLSRVPSIHFLHALYHEHKDHIVEGCRLVDQLDIGFYILNPNQDLKEMEARMIKFFERRIPEWKGLKGVSPSQEEFCQALTKHNLFVYCGHFNGTHFLPAEEISSLRVVALPLLFGCSSVALQDLGGLATPSSVTDKYFIAGSACIIGMQWTVTSDDADCMAVMILNSWLPGEPVDLTSFRNEGDMLSTQKESELLRLLRHARDAAHMYFNAAALIARGIPIKVIDS